MNPRKQQLLAELKKIEEEEKREIDEQAIKRGKILMEMLPNLLELHPNHNERANCSDAEPRHNGRCHRCALLEITVKNGKTGPMTLKLISKST